MKQQRSYSCASMLCTVMDHHLKKIGTYARRAPINVRVRYSISHFDVLIGFFAPPIPPQNPGGDVFNEPCKEGGGKGGLSTFRPVASCPPSPQPKIPAHMSSPPSPLYTDMSMVKPYQLNSLPIYCHLHIDALILLAEMHLEGIRKRGEGGEGGTRSYKLKCKIIIHTFSGETFLCNRPSTHNTHPHYY